MSIKIKLLFYFLCLSILIITTGLIFYVQLKNLIEPLTPQSIPRSIEKLEGSIEINNTVYSLLFQHQLTQNNLYDYVLNTNHHHLLNYYMNQTLFEELISEAKSTNPKLWNELIKDTHSAIQMNKRIVNLMLNNDQITARKLLAGSEFTIVKNNFLNTINEHYLPFDVSSNVVDIVTLRLAAKNTKKILFDSMNTTIIIFLDAIAISLLFAIYSAKAISTPINLLKQDIDKITSKNFDAPVNKDLLMLKGEVGALARSFISLIERLRSTTVSRDKLLIEIDRRIKSENDLRETAQRLEESNRELDQFAYSVSHDLRAPLRGIDNLADWIMEDCRGLVSEESRNHLVLIKARTKRLDILINGILEYSRAGKKSAANENIDVNKLLEDVIDSLSPPSNIIIVVDMPMPTFITSGPILAQVFLNLINNAIKFNDKAKGDIHIGYEDQHEHFKFYVVDNGPGIDSKYHKMIFELFQTLQPHDTAETAGVGLALVKKNVESQGGNVWVQSLVGKGSVFYFTWPKDKY